MNGALAHRQAPISSAALAFGWLLIVLRAGGGLALAESATSSWHEAAQPRFTTASLPLLGPYFVEVLASVAMLLAGVWIGLQIQARRSQHRLEARPEKGGLEAERSRIAQDMHDQLGSHLTRIKLLSELIGRQDGLPEAAAQHARHILRSTTELAQSMDEIVWAVNPKKDRLEHLISYVAAFTEELLGVTHLRFRLDLPNHVPDLALPTEARHHLFLALKEALHNSVKHSQATTVQVSLRLADTHLELTVQDDGIGIQPRPAAISRNGLKNMAERMRRIGGSCIIDSPPGAGTRVQLTSPLVLSLPDSHIRGT